MKDTRLSLAFESLCQNDSLVKSSVTMVIGTRKADKSIDIFRFIKGIRNDKGKGQSDQWGKILPLLASGGAGRQNAEELHWEERVV